MADESIGKKIKDTLGDQLGEAIGRFTDIKGQLRSVIQWEDPSSDVLFERWTENGDEIKNASKLIVGPGQGCLFVYEGRVESVITEEGLIELTTANIPFWTNIKKVMQAFESEHKVGLFFFRKTEILNSKWGTQSPVKYNDPVYKFPVGLKAHGNYSFKITEPRAFFTNIVGAKHSYRADDIREVITARIGQPLADHLAEVKFSYADIDANREEIAAAVTEKVIPIYESLGFRITDFRIEGTNFDDDTMRRINRIADVQAEAQAAQAAGIDYSKMQQLEALRDAAKNEGGIAGAGVGMGAGISLGQAMGGAMVSGNQQPGPAAAGDDSMQKLQKLKQMLDGELITQEEYDAKKKDILDSM